ncbi:uncharacterized protein TNCV_51361 [Trichonephila clavipes]|nr:uncharacterized protein TNCV_51361 [Trichonephila clavipes]
MCFSEEDRTVEEVATAMVERDFSFIYSSASGRSVSRELEIPWSTVILALQKRQCLQTTIFMQDGATPYVGRQVKELFSANFGDNSVISRLPYTWPSRSPNLNPCDFWLRGFLKDRFYSGEIRTLPDLKASIKRHVAKIPCNRVVYAIKKKDESTKYENLFTPGSR